MSNYAMFGGNKILMEHGNVLVAMDSLHHWVHRGFMFQAEYVNASLNNGANLDILLETGAEDTHLQYLVNAGGACRVYLYEGPTALRGTEVTPYNMRRAMANRLPTMKISHTPTVSATGTELVPGRYLPGGTSPTTRVGAEVRAGTEWVMKANTTYLIRVNNVSGGSIVADLALSFYEHDEEVV